MTARQPKAHNREQADECNNREVKGDTNFVNATESVTKDTIDVSEASLSSDLSSWGQQKKA